MINWKAKNRILQIIASNHKIKNKNLTRKQITLIKKNRNSLRQTTNSINRILQIIPSNNKINLTRKQISLIKKNRSNMKLRMQIPQKIKTNKSINKINLKNNNSKITTLHNNNNSNNLLRITMLQKRNNPHIVNKQAKTYLNLNYSSPN